MTNQFQNPNFKYPHLAPHASGKEERKTRGGLRRGFTLIELLVSIVIFMIFLGIVSTSYVSIVRAQKDANEVRKMYSDVRTFVDLLDEEARLGSVDYGFYDGTDSMAPKDFCFSGTGAPGLSSSGKSPFLPLIRKDGLEFTLFCYDKDAQTVWMKKYQKAAGDVWKEEDGYSSLSGVSYAERQGFQRVLSDSVKAKSLSFAIFPNVNPYSDDSAVYANNSTQFQPKVTLLMSIVNGTKFAKNFDMHFQTTLSSRVYSRAP